MKEMSEQTQNNTRTTADALSMPTLARAGILILLLVAAALIAAVSPQPQTAQRPMPPLPSSAQLHASSTPLSNLSLDAEAVFVYDVHTNTPIYAHNANAQLPLASLTKLMTAYTAAQSLSESGTVVVPRESLREHGDTGLRAQEQWGAKALLDFTLVTSSNDGADALASAAAAASSMQNTASSSPHSFVQAMNQNAETLGLSHTYFLNETGLDANGFIGGGYGSARDVGMLLAHIIHTQPELVEATARSRINITSRSNLLHTATNTNPAVGHIPGLIASKTGFTDLAGGNLAIAFDVGIGHPVVAVVLGSTYDGRFADMETIVNTTLDTFK